jgi:hypothetical protein
MKIQIVPKNLIRIANDKGKGKNILNKTYRVYTRAAQYIK